MTLKTFVKRHDSLLVVYVILLLVFGFGAVSSSRFLTGINIGNIMEQAVSLGIVSLGQLLTILLGGIDLSVGAVVSLSTTIMSLELFPGPFGVVVNLAITLLAGLAIGCLNGIGIARLRIPPFIMTLATMTIVNGIALKIRPTPGGSIPYEFMELLFGRIGIFPHAMIIWIVILCLLLWILHHREFGRNIYAVGGGSVAAELSGISVARIRIQAHIICSLIAAIAGICVAARMGSGDATLGDLLGMDSVTVCVLGGVSLFGGQGEIMGLLASTFVLSGISNILNMIGVSANYQYVCKALILLLTVLFFSIKGRKRETY